MKGNQIIIYNTEDGETKIDLKVFDETVWLNQMEIAELFQTTKQNISKHIKAIFEDGELDEKGTVNYKLTVQNEGARVVSRDLAYYSLDVILAIGYRVRSTRGVEFRRWANKVLVDKATKEEGSGHIQFVDYDNFNNNRFIIANQWTVVEWKYFQRRSD